MAHLIIRPRRLRKTPTHRRMIQETHLSRDDLIYPLFVCPGTSVREEISAMPGQYRLSVDELVQESQQIRDLGIPAIVLFGIPEHKDPVGSDAYAADGIIQTAVRAVKKQVSDLLVITDLCFCEYTSHGHCGILENNDVHNDKTLELTYKTAVSQAEAGADMIAPSGMMDGAVRVIRQALDENAFPDIPIMAYSAKYASSYYGPFREAADSGATFGDRTTYQMDYHNAEEALREVMLDIEEGADIVMVKPVLAYLDILYRVKHEFSMPTAAYNVSGEYAMIKAAAAKGWIDEQRIIWETLIAIKRAGADMILTYFAKDVAASLPA
ncbi:porphobilinogen synthase [candidate division KSB3 bacterium]|uniref:Delta-aminolevulinic acid dehydratase n=1 Tax=candidate division KSB3 bacterium TaxID=2044937 RepID=A0A9D5Q500_9BACT|nr:porphobilinogen synthase [candidate division KSB3 bacterium]MBD3323431.1 porphobilinogen synthase [candidate division KSB3 bacterium]